MNRENPSTGLNDRPSPPQVLVGPLMHDRDFKRFSELIYTVCGIKMPKAKRCLLESRLQKRLRALNMKDFSQYCDYVFSPRGQEEEMCNLIDVVSTNTTEFFREPGHFEILCRQVLPAWRKKHGGRALNVWSAGCSTGEEPYTLAMVLSDFARSNPGFCFHILATDISTQVLTKAARAIYPEERLSPNLQAVKKKYFLRGKGRSIGMVRVIPELRKLVCFERLNFMDDFHLKTPQDVIFCRNVTIYFDRKTQEDLIGKFCQNMTLGGYLFVGHSEAIIGMEVPLMQMAPTVYQRI